METVDSILDNYIENKIISKPREELLKEKIEGLRTSSDFYLWLKTSVFIFGLSLFLFLSLTEEFSPILILGIILSCFCLWMSFMTKTIENSVLLEDCKDIKELIEDTHYETRFSYIKENNKKGIKVIVEGNIASDDFIIKENSKSFTSYINSTDHKVIIKAIREIVRKQEIFFRK